MHTGIIRNRKVLPRWREVNSTTAVELQSATSFAPIVKSSDELMEFHYSVWQRDRSLENAFDVICYAQTSTNKLLAFGPAEHIIQSSHAPKYLKAIAEKIRYGRPQKLDTEVEMEPLSSDWLKQLTYKKIHNLKIQLQDEPANGLLWLDLARLQITLGNTHSSEDAMKHALAAAPNNRLVLRAAGRLFHHLGKSDEAHDRIRRSDAVAVDPWIQAAEIALASHAGKPSRFLKIGRSLINDDRFLPIHTSELAAAIGTEESRNGNAKTARKLFITSLRQPTDNTVAQAFWISNDINMRLAKSAFSINRAFEARAGAALAVEDYKTAANNCIEWCQDEPFSSAPAIQGSYIAATFLNDHDLAIQIYNFGKSANPHEPGLINNGVVALARSGNVQQAIKDFEGMKHLARGDSPDITALATAGLIEFRLGNAEDGRAFYKRSVQEARKINNKDIELRAGLNWLIEEINANTISATSVAKTTEDLDNIVKDNPGKIHGLSEKLWLLEKKRLPSDYQNSQVTTPESLLAK